MRYRDIIEGVTGYHGTKRSFKAFRMPSDNFHPSQIGIWFASAPEAAAHIGKTSSDGRSRPRVLSCEIEIGNTKAYDTYDDFIEDFETNYGGAGEMRAALIRGGYNSIQITHSDTDGAAERTDWAVFDRTQVKVERSDFI